MKTTKLLGVVGLVLGSYSFSEAQSVSEIVKPAPQQKVEVTEALKERVINGAAKASNNKVQALTIEQAKTLSEERKAKYGAKNSRKKKGETPQQTTK